MLAILILFPFAVGATLITLGLLLPLARLLWRESPRFMLALASLMVICFFGILYYGHCQALNHLTQVEVEYQRFVKLTEPKGYCHDGEITRYYYPEDQRRLDTLLAKRDTILKEKGFIMLGDWKALVNGPYTEAVYLLWK